MNDQQRAPRPGFLPGIRVLELADELGEYCGKVLAGLGADVIKVEPPAGEKTRRYGPFYEDHPHPHRSLYFWHYNFGKRGITLNLDENQGRKHFLELVKRADVVLETRPRGFLEQRGLGYEALKSHNRSLIVARISPFGDGGPWGDYKASDLVHLALGGVMMNCGYDPDPSGFYETPPVAPQMWQSYHIAGEMAAMAIVGALCWRQHSGKGQYLSTAVHDAVAKQTETDIPNWIYSRLPHARRTGLHSRPNPNEPASIALTKDGRWLLPYHTYLELSSLGQDKTFRDTVAVLGKYGSAEDLTDEKYSDPAFRSSRLAQRHIGRVINAFVGRFLFDRDIWREFQEAGLTWGPLRRPEENLADSHWRTRDTFVEVEHAEVGKTFTEIGAKWLCSEVPWPKGPRAPLLGEHNQEVLGSLPEERVRIIAVPGSALKPKLSKRGKPFALAGVRFIDLSWLVASAGAGRFLAALGAEVIKVEHKTRWDIVRWGNGIPPEGGRRAREQMTESIRFPGPRPESPNRSGFFMDLNSGKRAISLNLKQPQGKVILTELLKKADVVAEGFSPGTMDRMGFGYQRLKEINPRIVYVQQSGMGQMGTYGEMRSYGPVAAGFSGLSEMTGLPEPYPPAGIGYSYLDWFGAYNMAIAIIAGLYRQRVTGQGCWIDASQVETGTYLVGTTILDHSANGRSWRRYGNRSPYKPAAPHGVYRTAGNDRWIAIACFDEEEWQCFLGVVDHPEWGRDPRFATLESRLANQDELDKLVGEATQTYDGNTLMERLQRAGVAAGICQTAEDRADSDPQLKYLEWMVELQQTEIGTWPVKEFPVKFSETPPYMGGSIDRHGPNYAEDNAYVYGRILGLSAREIQDLARQDVI